MLAYGQGCYETVFRVADGISPSAAESLDLPTSWNVFVQSSESHAPAESYRFVRRIGPDILCLPIPFHLPELSDYRHVIF